MLELASGDARVFVLPDEGGRIASFRVGGHELLRTPDDDPGSTHWGSFVMAPWAGRTRHGRFTFEGVGHQLAINAGAHAIHGTVRDRPWAVDDVDGSLVRMTCNFGPAWPFAGWAEQLLVLRHDRLDLELSLHATHEAMPAVGGWHPWWQRRLTGGDPVDLDLVAGAMYVRDDEGITTSATVPPPPGPWDDCFTDLARPPVLRWPNALELTIESDCPCVVVYDEPEDSVCVEPQSAPPDALNHEPAVATPGHPVVVHSTWRWAS